MIQDIVRGVRLALRPGEWRTPEGVVGAMHLDVFLQALVLTGDGYEVTGHLLECRWESVNCPFPCVYIEVPGPALAMALTRV